MRSSAKSLFFLFCFIPIHSILWTPIAPICLSSLSALKALSQPQHPMCANITAAGAVDREFLYIFMFCWPVLLSGIISTGSSAYFFTSFTPLPFCDSWFCLPVLLSSSSPSQCRTTWAALDRAGEDRVGPGLRHLQVGPSGTA